MRRGKRLFMTFHVFINRKQRKEFFFRIPRQESRDLTVMFCALERIPSTWSRDPQGIIDPASGIFPTKLRNGMETIISGEMASKWYPLFWSYSFQFGGSAHWISSNVLYVLLHNFRCRSSEVSFTIRCEFAFGRKEFPADQEVFTATKKLLAA